ncbi:helix-turn-helix domain-containing protein [Chromobacterium vaccinii]|uniref:helix-turn-helix domain-containing protein n=1 Tax=Chromobacterium vaccinii TaxID=1108595 RepID=UPI003C72B907
MMMVQSMQALQHKCVYRFNMLAREMNTTVFDDLDTIVFMSTYGERVRARRMELGLSQGELAKLIGAKNQSTIGNIENRNGASRKTRLLAKALKVRYDWLETGEGEKELPPEDDSGTLLLSEASLSEILAEVERRGAGDSARLLAELVLKNNKGG